MAIFGPKPGVNAYFSTVWSSCFYSLESRFFFYNIVKDIFLASITKKKKLEKWPFLDQNLGLTPLEKCHFLAF